MTVLMLLTASRPTMIATCAWAMCCRPYRCARTLARSQDRPQVLHPLLFHRVSCVLTMHSMMGWLAVVFGDRERCCQRSLERDGTLPHV